ncbi:hypothetical protein AB4212_26900 [Streptomyces sp. 2MCAF27]
MCAYAFLKAVIDGPQVDDLLHVPPAPLDFEELLVTERDVLGGQARVGVSQQVLAVEVLLGLDLRGVDAELAGRCGAEVAVEAGLAGDLPPELASLELAEAVGVFDQGRELGDELFAYVLVTGGGLGVVTDHEPLGVGDPHFFDPHVLGDLAVAALAGQGSLHLRTAGAEFLADDIGVVALAEVAAVAFAGESPSVTHTILLKVQSRMSSLTCRISFWSPVLPGQDQTRTGIPSLVTAIAITICGRSSRESFDLPKVRNPVWSAGSPSSSAGGRSSVRRRPLSSRSRGSSGSSSSK